MTFIADDPQARKLHDVTVLANTLLREHGLDDWTFRLTNAKRLMGQAVYDDKEIHFSMNFLHVDWAKIEDTIRHEIAHALTDYTPRGRYRPKSHGPEWQMKAIEVGAKPRACHKETSQAEYKYLIKCTGCKREWKRYRLRRGWSENCGWCGAPLKYFEYVEDI